MGIFSRSSEQNILQEALRMVNDGNVDKAIKLFLEATNLEKTEPEAFLYLGDAYEFLGEFEKAISTYKDGIEKHPTFINNYFDLAILLMRYAMKIKEDLFNYPMGKFAKIVESGRLYFLQAGYLGDSESIKILQKENIMVYTKQDCMDELLKIGDKYIEKQDHEKLIEIYSFIYNIDHNNEDAMNILAVSYLNIGQIFDNEEKHKTALKNYAKAHSFAMKLYNKNPNDSKRKDILGSILFTIGNLFAYVKNHKKAILYLEKAKLLLSNKFDLLKTLGQQYSFNGQTELGENYLSEYAKTHEIDFNSLLEETKLRQYNLYLDKVNLLAGNRGHKQVEIDSIKKAIALYPNKQDAHYFLGICFTDMGELELAKKAYQKALEVDPNGDYTSIIINSLNSN